MFKQHKLILIGCLSLVSYDAVAMFPINYFRPYDPNVYKPYRSEDGLTDIAITPEFGLKTVGFSTEDVPCNSPKKKCKVNVLRVWQDQQDALAMLKGFSPSSEIGSLAQQLNVDDDNGVRGHLKFCGDLDVKANIILSNRWYLPHGFILGLYLPVVSLKLTTCFKDQTQMITAEDFLTKSLLTNNFAENVRRLGCLNILGWQETGIGDAAVIIDWARSFPQSKPLLKNVVTRLRAGISLPTGKRINPDDMFSIPLGNDGAFGILVGAGLDLQLARHFKTGIDIEFLQLFGNVRERRVKTDVSQDDLLLLAKTCVLKHFGFTHRFNLYAELSKILGGLSLNFTYQCWKHDNDQLFILSKDFSSEVANKGKSLEEVANTAKSLEEWTMHHFIYKISYDFEPDFPSVYPKPYLAFFYKQPINGKNSFLAHTVGFIASLSF